MATRRALLLAHQRDVRACRACPQMIPPSVICGPVLSEVLLVGQAPGDKEPKLGRPFAWTAGKELFKWFTRIGLDEEQFRSAVYMAAVCRCFPGKNPKGGDRVPSDDEIERCRPWLEREIEILRPKLVLPVGKLAIGQILDAEQPLVEVVGRVHSWRHGRRNIDVIPLPHPSGASTWHRTEPGRSLLQAALRLVAAHPAWQALLARRARAVPGSSPDEG